MITYDVIATDKDGRKLTIFKDVKNIQSAEHMRDWFKGRYCIGVEVEIAKIQSMNRSMCEVKHWNLSK